MPSMHEELLALRADKRKAGDQPIEGCQGSASKRPCHVPSGGSVFSSIARPNATNLAFQQTVFRCAACLVDCSGEVRFHTCTHS